MSDINLNYVYSTFRNDLQLFSFTFYHRRRSDLIIKAAQKSDNGVYECRAKNKLTNKRRPVSQSMRLDVIYYGDGSDHRTSKAENLRLTFE